MSTTVMADRPATTLEVVVLFAPIGLATDDSLKEAWALLERASGYCGHQFGPCIEEPGRYLLLIWWRRIEDHLLTFRQSAAYARWKELIDTNVDSVSSVHHFSVSARPAV
jgi:hypothetical protein